MAELILTKEEQAKADKANKAKVLYCIECCTTFLLDESGKWSTRTGDKVAELIGNDFLQCTCGANLATLLRKSAVKGEFVAMQ